MTENIEIVKELLKKKDFLKAEQILKKMYFRGDRNYVTLQLLGHSLLFQQNYEEAIEYYLQIPKSYQIWEIYLNLAHCYLNLQEYQKCIFYSEKAIKDQPTKFQPYINLCECYLRIHQYEESYNYAKQYLKLHNDIKQVTDIDFMNTYLDLLLALNKEEEYKIAALTFLENNYNPVVLNHIIQKDKKLVPTEYIQKALDEIENEKNFLNLVDKSKSLIDFAFSLGKFYEKTDSVLFEKYIRLGNEFATNIQRYNPFVRQKHISRVVDYFLKTKDDQYPSIPATKGSGCIFIVGMPRSGTSLLENILTTDNVFPGDERIFFNTKLSPIIINEKFESIDENFMVELGNEYLSHVDESTMRSNFFIDKMPGNYQFVGFIKRALPAAKIIYIHRNPWDNATSLFKENYVIRQAFSSKFFTIAMEYAGHEAIMGFWQSFFQKEQNSIFEIQYEDLVQETETIAKELWQFIGLEGEYNETKKNNRYMSFTASKFQVRKNVHRSSVNKSIFVDEKAQFEADLEQQRDYWKKKLKSQ
tara:strand:+ start:1763 stop:3349 length:1587 start_codon:yes stop_codon:yes gene_type:complete